MNNARATGNTGELWARRDYSVKTGLCWSADPVIAHPGT